MSGSELLTGLVLGPNDENVSYGTVGDPVLRSIDYEMIP
jgi:hypothetical protein